MNDVFFHDDKNGYIVGNDAKFYTVKNVGTATTPDYWLVKKTIDDPVLTPLDPTTNPGANDRYHVQCIAFGSRYDGVYGGSYKTPKVGDMIPTSFVRKVHHEESQFSARFFYDRLGRLIVSQNSRQYAQSKFSYTLYDEHGRVHEVGEKTENTGANPKFKSIFGAYVGLNLIPSVIDDYKLSLWVNNPAGARKEVTKSYYDETNDDILSQMTVPFAPNPTTQRKRIVHVTYEEVYDNYDSTYNHATHYDYDIHGNVVTLLQDNKSLEFDSDIANKHRFKRMDYIFDLVSGNVHRMDYQTGEADQWHHAYKYDADNRITDVYTTTATPLMTAQDGMASVQVEMGLSTYWDRDAKYTYYDHGPLARTLLGQEAVQGTDYAYTLQGWLKGVNSNSLTSATDIGKDGWTNGPNALVARDVSSFSLHYFNTDYAAILPANNNSATNFIAAMGSGGLASNTPQLYNGNIGRMITTITNPTTRDILPMGNAYQYDQLQRLKQSESYYGLDVTTNTWTSQMGGHYQNFFDFDANGNIEHQIRYDENGNVIDNLEYKYNVDANGKKTQNRLFHLNEDPFTATDYSDDIDDQDYVNVSDPTNSASYNASADNNGSGNYRYDQEGRLIKDVQEHIKNIIWRVDGKVKKIEKRYDPNKPNAKNVSFDYDLPTCRLAGRCDGRNLSSGKVEE